MGYKIPERLNKYLNSNKYRAPFENFVTTANYYSQLSWQWIDYMQNVVRPCIAFSTASVDGVYGDALSVSTGMSILRGATRLVAGDRVFFTGNDEACEFLSDVWMPATNFQKQLTRMIAFMLQAGTSVVKLNKDEYGRVTLSPFRLDRTIISFDETGNVTEAIFFISLLSNMKNDAEMTYWLTETRKYNEEGKATICYKVHSKAGTVNNPVLPDASLPGIKINNLSGKIREELRKIGVSILNEEIPLDIRDGLGVWTLARTASNSCIPDCALGDPLLYGCLDILWSIDVLYTGTIVDVLNGEGKILVPKQFLQQTLAQLRTAAPGTDFQVTTSELSRYDDETFVYVQPSMFDKDKQSPTPVQFDIRAEQYGRMWELYERAVCVRAGFSPTSIFPYLTPDNSAKTATEVTAEENLTWASIKEVHSLIVPVINRMIREVLWQEGYSDDVQIQLSDYIGNKLQYDANIRDNLQAGVIPLEVAVKQINNLTDGETADYLAKIKKDKEESSNFGDLSEFYKGINDNGYSATEDSGQPPQSAGDSLGRGGNGDPDNGKAGLFGSQTESGN